MDVSTVIADVKSIQNALQVLSVLNLTQSLFPQQTQVKGCSTFDFIIVGGGTAGCMVAHRLTEIESVNVLLIEAGGNPPIESLFPALYPYLLHSPYAWNYKSERDEYSARMQKKKNIYVPQGKMLGGGSSFDFMLYTHGDKHTYDTWAKMIGDDSWSYENILEYIKKNERLEDPAILNSSHIAYHGTNGNIGLTKVPMDEITKKYLEPFRELGHEIVLDLSGNCTLGFSGEMVMVAEGIRQSTAFSFLTPIRNRPNLKVLKNTEATKVLFDEKNNAIGVRVLTENNKKLSLYARKEVILSAGAINTPKLLMLSGVGPAQHLKKLNISVKVDLPVGCNMQNPVFTMVELTGEKSNAAVVPRSIKEYPDRGFEGFVALNESQTYADYEQISYVVPHDWPIPTLFCSYAYEFIDEVCKKVLNNGKGRELLISLIVLLDPKSRGEILLRSKKPADKPIIRFNDFSNDNDVENQVKNVKNHLRILNTTYFRSINSKFVDLSNCSETYEYDSNEFWQCYVLEISSSIYRYAGTCAMGKVVDTRLRVYGIRQLRVVGNAVLPTSPRGHNTAATIMVSEKACVMIKEDHNLEK